MSADENEPPSRPPTVVQSPDDQARVAAALEPRAPVSAPTIPNYEIVQKLGEGGMGAVYLARDLRLKREVALKMLHATDSRPESIARFWAEAEVMAAVKHPHVVQVFELGKDVSCPFIAMEYLAGGSLADRLKGGAALPPREAAEVLEKIARGVAAAHELGVVHRDLKPGNVLLAVDGEPKVADFGIAKRPNQAELTATGVPMGTPLYSSPEQANGQTKFVNPQTDVWALGVILYEALTGQRPFVGDNPLEILVKSRNDEPVPPRKLVAAVPRDLETIVTKCLSKEPEHRYATAGELADDLGRFVRGEPIAARPVGLVEHAVRWAQRKPAAASAYGFSSLAVALAVLVFVIFGFWREAEKAKGNADVAKDDAVTQRLRAEGLFADADRLKGVAETALKGEELAKQELERQFERVARLEYGRTIQVAYQMWRDNRLTDARTVLKSTREDLRGWEYDYVHRLCHADLATLEGHTNEVHSASFSHDGTKAVTASADNTARVWDATTGKLLAELKGHTDWVRSASFNHDGTKAVTASADKTARVWDVTGKTLAEFKGHTNEVISSSFSSDGSKVVTASEDNTARVWDATTGKTLAEFKGHAKWVLSASFSSDGSKVVTTSSDNTARVWETQTGKTLVELTRHLGVLRSASFSSDGTKVMTASEGTAQVWDTVTGNTLTELKGHDGSVLPASFNSNGTKVMTVSRDNTVWVWDVATGRLLAELKGHEGELVSASFNHDGSKVVTASMDNTARVWDATTGKTLAELKGLPEFAPRDAITGATTGKTLVELKGHTHWVVSASFSFDGTKVVTASRDHTARVWDLQASKPTTELNGDKWVKSASFNSAGTKVLTVSENITRMWDARTGKPTPVPDEPITWVNASSFSSDGSKAATVNEDKTVRVWDAATGKTLAELKGHTNWVRSATFNHDASRVVTASADNTARVWDTATGAELLALPGGGFAGFSPDGTRIVTHGKSYTVLIYDSRPVNRAFLRFPVAPPPRVVGAVVP